MKDVLRILIVEDQPCDLALIRYSIKHSGLSFTDQVVETREEYIRALGEFKPDIILSDYYLPVFNGMSALNLKMKISPGTPFILMTGEFNEKTAVEVMKAGAQDYILKDRLQRLVPAIHSALEKGRLVQSKIRVTAELEESELNFRLLADSGQALIWISGLDRGVGFFNRPWLAFTGRSLDKELGFGWTKGIHPEDKEAFVDLYKEQFTKREKFRIKFRILHTSGEYRWLQNDASPRFNTHGDFTGFIGYCIDITDLIHAEERILQYNEQLRGLAAHMERVREEERITLSRDMHDILGSSLSSLKLELRILQHEIERFLPDPGPEITGKLQAMAAQVDVSIGVMRRFVHQLRPELLDDLGLIEAIRRFAREMEERSGIEIIMTFFPKHIQLDQQQSIILYRIFQEILTNIIRHSRATKATLFVKKQEDSLMIRVTDNGIGISRQDMVRSDSFGILGMKERVLLLGGQIDITGTRGRGTVISLQVPLQ
ncbi:MAG TPA: response regulator [Bacteroidales bacterium]|nr:response regulator [Bacteroidales bacterium]HPS61456.1 response regulator [Bacteroidales bacterium]